MELIKHVQKWGNSSGVLLPREWVNKEVKITLIDRSLEIKNEAFHILDSYLYDIMGIYLTGSYSRGEQDSNSDIDIIAISNSTKKEITSGKYNVSIIPLEVIEKTLINNPLMILPRLIEAKAITNSQLLNRLVSIKINNNSFLEYISDTKRLTRVNEGLINLDSGALYLESNELIYSLILRIRGMYLISCILDNKPYSNKDFLRLLKSAAPKDYLTSYEVYRAIKSGKKSKSKILFKTAQSFLDLLKKEVLITNAKTRKKTSKRN